MKPMERSLADRYLDGEIEVDEYTARVIEEAEAMARNDLAWRTRRIVDEIGGVAGDAVTVNQVEE
jgi:hypothetical protein